MKKTNRPRIRGLSTNELRIIEDYLLPHCYFDEDIKELRDHVIEEQQKRGLENALAEKKDAK